MKDIEREQKMPNLKTSRVNIANAKLSRATGAHREIPAAPGRAWLAGTEERAGRTSPLATCAHEANLRSVLPGFLRFEPGPTHSTAERFD